MLSNWLVPPLFGLVSVVSQAGIEQPPLVNDQALQDAGMFRYWQASVPVAPGDALIGAELVDDAVYAKTRNGTLFSLASQTGLLRWGVKLTDPDYTIHKPTHIRTNGGTGPVIIATTTAVFIHDRYSGDLMRRFDPGFASGSATVALDDLVFMGSADGRFYSLLVDLARGIGPVRRWEVLTGGPVTATPVIHGLETLILASQGGTVYSCSGWDKSLDWSFQTRGPILGDPVTDAGGVYVASMDRTLYKLDISTGRLLWRQLLPKPLTEGPVLAAHTVFQYCDDIGLVAYDAQTGREKWRRGGGRHFVAHSRNEDALLTRDRSIELVNNTSGVVRSTIRANSIEGCATNTTDDAIYLFSRAGRVVCIRVDTVPYLRRQQVIAARRTLHLPPIQGTGDTPATDAASPAQPSSVTDPLRSRRDRRP